MVIAPMKQDGSCPAHSPEELSLFLSGDLSPRRTRDILRHLPQCPVCRQRLQELGSVRNLLRQAPVPLPPRSYTLSPAVRLRRRILWYPFLRGATIAGVILALLVFVVDLFLLPTYKATVQGLTTVESRAGPPTAVVGPAITRRNPPATVTGLVTPLPAYVGGTAMAYPAPSLATSPDGTSPTLLPGQTSGTPQPGASPGPSLLTFLRLGGLLFLGLLAGLTWIAYRRERPFLS